MVSQQQQQQQASVVCLRQTGTHTFLTKWPCTNMMGSAACLADTTSR
jgi:hypothetical protein